MKEYYFNASSPYCNKTVKQFVSNLTSSYADQSNEGTMVATSVVMFVLAALFFNLNLFSRFSDISAILNPSIRLFLSTSLSLFLPVMSYLFSEAKNVDTATHGQMTELSLRARTILMWMLLVELLRKKVEEILVTVGSQRYSGTIERAARIAWLGYLVFHNLKSAGKKAFYGILWVLAAAKLVQRFVTMELGKCSFAYGRNPQLLTSYMDKMRQEGQLADRNGELLGSELLEECKYVVMGEENLEKKAGPSGYRLELTKATDLEKKAGANGCCLELTEAIAKDGRVVTVGKIWSLAKTDELLKSDPRLKRLCLSFSLHKLLRRRLEDFPITGAEAQNCHDLIFNGLCKEETNEEAKAVALFQVFNDQVIFLCEHYHSIHPVVFASPFFFLVNYIMFPIVVWAMCVFIIILCSNGDVVFAFRSFLTDNYFKIMKQTGCILTEITGSPPELFTVVDISITIILICAVIYEEVWEFLVFLLSNWFVVSLLCSYTSNSRRHANRFLRGLIRCILWVRNMLSQHNVCFKQFSVLWFFRLSSVLPSKAVPVEAKKAILQRMANVNDVTPLSNGSSMVRSADLSWACESDSIAEVILTWHIATALLEARHPLRKPGADRMVASALSGYCAYLVAFRPELLPDDRDGTEFVYNDTMAELKKEMGCWGYYCSRQGARCDKLMEIAGHQDVAEADTATASVLRKGARLGKALIEKYDEAATEEDGRELVWKLLADVWSEVMVYAAPTGSEHHVKAHEEALAQGGEFITVLWALATHTGIARPVATPASA